MGGRRRRRAPDRHGCSRDAPRTSPGFRRSRVVATCSVGFDHVAYEEAARRGSLGLQRPRLLRRGGRRPLARPPPRASARSRGARPLARGRRVGLGGGGGSAAHPRDPARGVGFGRPGARSQSEPRRSASRCGRPIPPFLLRPSPRRREGSLARRAPRDLRGVLLASALTPETKGLIGAQELARMPRGSVAGGHGPGRAGRPGRAPESARERAPRRRGPGRAPAPSRRPASFLRRPPRLVVTPHAAWYSAEAEEAVYRRPVLSVRDRARRPGARVERSTARDRRRSSAAEAPASAARRLESWHAPARALRFAAGAPSPSKRSVRSSSCGNGVPRGTRLTSASPSRSTSSSTRALERSGRIDILVNNAGGQFLAPAEEISPNGWRAVHRLGRGRLVEHDPSRGDPVDDPEPSGVVIFIGFSPRRGIPEMAHASAARAALENLAGSLSNEWSRTGSGRCASPRARS